jgi:phosphoribosylanthranilate isomerase
LTPPEAYARIQPASQYSTAGAILPSIKDVKIKVCGITTVEDARLVAESGADYIGVIVGVDFSPRNLGLDSARLICEQSMLPAVTLFFNWEAEQIQKAVITLNPHAVQLLGHEPPSLVRTLKKTVACEIWKSIHLPPQGLGEANITGHQNRVNSLIDAGIDAVIIDTVVGSSGKDMRYGGTGQVNNWTVARSLVEAFPVRTFLAGGITPENIRQAIELVHPYGIDLCSGVEIAPGQKDPEKLRRLMSAIGRAIPERG